MEPRESPGRATPRNSETKTGPPGQHAQPPKEGDPLSRATETACYDLHGVLRVRTNTHIVPELPAYLRVDLANPELDVVRLDTLRGPDPGRVRASLGHPGTRDLGDGEVFYEFPMPLIHLLGVSGNWRLSVKGLLEDETTLTTAIPYFRVRPIASRSTELLSRIVYFILGMKLWRKGHALCHASALAHGDTAFLFFGYIGSGKTLVSLALMGAACDSYISDDTTMVDRQGIAYCWPEAHAPHSEGLSMPLLRYLRRRQHVTSLPDYPIRRQARARGIFFLERGRDEIIEIDADDAIRRAMLVNLDEMSRYWNSPVAQLVNQYAYFYPELDLSGLVDSYTSCIGSFIQNAGAYYVVRSASPAFEGLRRTVADLT